MAQLAANRSLAPKIDTKTKIDYIEAFSAGDGVRVQWSRRGMTWMVGSPFGCVLAGLSTCLCQDQAHRHGQTS